MATPPPTASAAAAIGAIQRTAVRDMAPLLLAAGQDETVQWKRATVRTFCCSVAGARGRGPLARHDVPTRPSNKLISDGLQLAKPLT